MSVDNPFVFLTVFVLAAGALGTSGWLVGKNRKLAAVLGFS